MLLSKSLFDHVITVSFCVKVYQSPTNFYNNFCGTDNFKDVSVNKTH